MEQIVDLQMQEIRERMDEQAITVELTEAARKWLAGEGYDPAFGARPLKRAIQKYLEDPMAEVIIEASIKEGDTIAVGFDENKEEITVKVQKSRKPASKSEESKKS